MVVLGGGDLKNLADEAQALDAADDANLEGQAHPSQTWGERAGVRVWRLGITAAPIFPSLCWDALAFVS